MAINGSLNSYCGVGAAEASELPPHFQRGIGSASSG
eukprot:CAMPEP_0174361126 /NCGR_PEP_ID=MMETSP0811_2-20130205/57693_1 /TAXON_ID=73025 ORGANISM="Eutreptiella gymnastica-like, Strain CCMP1594" /NCGR_SAMPLE_ID=MMETSP0811_2 /ASSEMBLY_ACC=CAM_ASM_000667 /LENGTH=35 /DNA_ID= /DNA_START= /DNA_END= /DNA_ORIENTATION=